jgi:hypothetical protein
MINMIQCGRDGRLEMSDWERAASRRSRRSSRRRQHAPGCGQDAICCVQMPAATRLPRTDWMRPPHNRAAGIRDDGQLGRGGHRVRHRRSNHGVQQQSAEPNQLPTSEVVVAWRQRGLGEAELRVQSADSNPHPISTLMRNDLRTDWKRKG